MHIRYLSRRIMGRIKKNGSEKGTKSAAVTVIMFCAAASAAVFFGAEFLMGIFIDPQKTQIIQIGTGYLKTEGACYCGIGILVFALRIFPGSGKTESFSSSYDPLTWNTGCPCLCMCAVVRRWSDLDGDTDRLGDGGCAGIILLRRGERTNRMNEIM